MKQGLLTIAVLLGACMAARADYIIIIANISQAKEPAAGAGGGVGAAGQFANFGMMGGRPPNAGMAGAGGFPPNAGAAGAGGFPPNAGMAGAGGFPPNAGAAGAGGFPPNAGMAGMMGGFQQGAENMGFGGGFAGAGGTTPKGPPPMRAMVVIETTDPVPARVSMLLQKPIVYAKHKWGESWIWGLDVELEQLRNGKRVLAAVSTRFEYEKKQLTAKGAKATPEGLLNLAEWALTHGLIPEFEKTMQELALLDKSNPAADAFTKVKAALDAKIPSSIAANRWKDKTFRRFQLSTNDYYALLHKSRDDASDVISRLKHLKENFVAFYYWHALKGKVLPMPKDKLVCVLAPAGDRGDSGDSFAKQNELFDSVPITADSFYSPRYNLVVFSTKRDDRPYKGLVKAADSLWTDFSRDDVLKKGARVPDKAKGKVNVGHLYQAQTYSLLLRAMEEDTEQASVSHSGTRQILVGAGLMPHSVDLPQWIQSGIGSFMQTPYGSPWRGYGAPHWSYLLSFRELKKDKKLPPADQLLRSVIADTYFKEGKKKDPSVKARATAWALTYFLAQKKLDYLQSYFKQLSRLPRDIDLDGDALLDCFARAFDCMDGSNKRDDRKLSDLAEAWMNFMEEEVKLDNEAQDILAAIHKLQNELAEEMKENDKPQPAPAPAPGGFPGGGFTPRPGG